ncbi:MAG TPA: DinB family protein [Candidatus Koribacter sp.]|jgi:uncharacterized damage-inducible protein DinB
MAATAVEPVREVEIFRSQNKFIWLSVEKNCAEVTHEESLVRPQPGGNSMNWIVGHLLCVYNNVLPMLGQPPVMLTEKLKRYDRGSQQVTAETALPFEELLAGLKEAIDRWDAGLAAATNEALDRKAPFSPFNDPNETVRSVIGFLMFHQGYHTGQTGVLRRVIGKAGSM